MKRFKYKNQVFSFNPYCLDDYDNICLKIDDIKKALHLDFSTYKKDGTIKKCTNENVSETQHANFDTLDYLSFYNELTRDPPINQQQAAQIAELQARIAELEQENQNLKKPEQQNQKIVNYDKCSIYGHSSEGIEIIFKISKTIAETCDPDNPHSYPSKQQIIDEVKRTYSDSNELATAIYQVITADKVKKRGRPPKEIDTFQGFR